LQRLVLDSNLVVLLAVGRTDISLIGRHKRTLRYSVDDFRKLAGALKSYGGVCTTHGVLAETSNLLMQAPADPSGRLLQTFRSFALEALVASQSAAEIVTREEFPRLGFTDCGLLAALGNGDDLMTMDLELYLTAYRLGLSAINFNHLRDRFV
jgi:hypothetical protein